MLETSTFSLNDRFSIMLRHSVRNLISYFLQNHVYYNIRAFGDFVVTSRGGAKDSGPVTLLDVIQPHSFIIPLSSNCIIDMRITQCTSHILVS